MRVLTLDIETRPHLGHVWALWDQNVGLNQLVEVGSVICFAGKWLDERKVHFHSDHHDGHDEMLRRAWEMYDEADAVITYNGRSFDNKHLRREWLLAGLTPPSPHKDIDLLSVVRRQFKFASNKLQHVASELGIGSKVQHDGFDLWVRCMADDPTAWNLMRRYCKGDVQLTEQLYERLLPWVQNHPHHGLYDRNVNEAGQAVCQRCGSAALTKRGYAYTNVSKFVRYRCKDCGSYSRAKHAEATVGIRQAV